MDNYQILNDINILQFNNEKSIEIFKFIYKNKINHTINGNNIYFDLSILSQNQLFEINNILIK